MVCSTRSCKMLLLQRISLLLNGLFFAHLLLLFYGSVFMTDQSTPNDIQSDLSLKNGRMLFSANDDQPAEPAHVSVTPNSATPPELQKSKGKRVKSETPLPTIYMITPTVNKPTRKADFTRLAQTVRQVPNLHWIVVEDGYQLCGSVTNILKRLIENYTYLAAPTPDYKMLGFDRELNKGIFQRNVALEWLRWKHKAPSNQTRQGVVYFADDDNTYDLRLFEIIRAIRLVGVWPVALVGGVKLEKPRRDPSSGQLLGFDVGFAPNRTFAVDMAGFALGLDLVVSTPQGHFPLDTVRGWNEPALFDSFDLSYDDVQVFGLDVRTPDGLLEPLVWHTKTTEANLGEEPRFKKNYGRGASDDGWEV